MIEAPVVRERPVTAQLLIIEVTEVFFVSDAQRARALRAKRRCFGYPYMDDAIVVQRLRQALLQPVAVDRRVLVAIHPQMALRIDAIHPAATPGKGVGRPVQQRRREFALEVVRVGEGGIGQGECLGQQARNLHTGDTVGAEGIQQALCLGAGGIAAFLPSSEDVTAEINERLGADAQHESDWAAALTSESASWDWVARACCRRLRRLAQRWRSCSTRATMRCCSARGGRAINNAFDFAK